MIDHDQLFKKLLREFFREFVAAFLPAVAEYLDPAEITFLDKELFAGLPPGEQRRADLVVRVKFKGQAAHFLVHCEPESSRRRKVGEFGKRLLVYCAILTRDHGLPVYPVAILSYDKPHNLEADSLRIEFPDKVVLEFRFTIIQLNRLNWRDFLKQDNPVAAALMAKMGFAPEERVEVKKECLRMIVRLQYDRERTRFLTVFVDTYLRLTAEENEQLKKALKELPQEEQEATMELTTSWKEEGLQEGLQQGLQRERALVLRQLALRIGALSQHAQAQIAQLSIEKVEKLGEELLNFQAPRDLTQWLREHAATNGKTNGQKVRK